MLELELDLNPCSRSTFAFSTVTGMSIHGPHPRDITCHSQTPPPEVDATDRRERVPLTDLISPFLFAEAPVAYQRRVRWLPPVQGSPSPDSARCELRKPVQVRDGTGPSPHVAQCRSQG